MTRRAFFSFTLAVDLDMVPGRFHQPEDWVELLRHELGRGEPYRSELTIHATAVRPYAWDGERYAAPESPFGDAVAASEPPSDPYI